MRLSSVLLVALATAAIVAEARPSPKDDASTSDTYTSAYTKGVGKADAWGGGEANDDYVKAGEKTIAATKYGSSNAASKTIAKSDKDKKVAIGGASSAGDYSFGKTEGHGFADDYKSTGSTKSAAGSAKGKATAISKGDVVGPTGDIWLKSNSEAKGYKAYTEGGSEGTTTPKKTEGASGSHSSSEKYGSASTYTEQKSFGDAGDVKSSAYTSAKKNADSKASSGGKATEKTAEGGTYASSASEKPGWSKSAAKTDAESGNGDSSVKSSTYTATDNNAHAVAGSKGVSIDKKDKVAVEGAASTKALHGVAKATTDAKAEDEEKTGKDNEAKIWTGGHAKYGAEGNSFGSAKVKDNTATTDGHASSKSFGGEANMATKTKAVSDN